MDLIFERIMELKRQLSELELPEDDKYGKLIAGILDTMEELTDTVAFIADETPDMFEFDEDREDEYRYVCPSCNEPLVVDEITLEANESMVCPNCFETISIIKLGE